MKFTTGKVVAASLIIVIVIASLFILYQRRAGCEKISRFGKYQGYSEAVYDGYQRRSEYLTLSNGTRLTYDLILPTKKGVPAKGPLPTLFKRTPVSFRSPEGLAEELPRPAGSTADPVIVINADAKASHQSVIHVMELARLAGYARITFTTQSNKK